MRKIKIIEWEEGNGSDSIKVNTTKALEILLDSSQIIPKGIESFKTMAKMASAFENVKDNILVLEEREYTLIKNIIEKELPPKWGKHKSIALAIDEVLNVKEE